MHLSDAMQSLENRQEARKLGLLPKAKVSQPDASDRSRRSVGSVFSRDCMASLNPTAFFGFIGAAQGTLRARISAFFVHVRPVRTHLAEAGYFQWPGFLYDKTILPVKRCF
jgi:hypothetical protein